MRTIRNHPLCNTWLPIQKDISLSSWVFGIKYHVTVQLWSVYVKPQFKARSTDEIYLVFKRRVQFEWKSQEVDEVQCDACS